MAHVTAIVLALISGVLISSDLIISKDTAMSINRTLYNWLRLSTTELPLSGRAFTNSNTFNIKKTFMVSAILAVVGVAGWITYLILKDSQTGSTTNIGWVPIFAGGFVVGLAAQWFLINLLNLLLRLVLKKEYEFFAILGSSGLLIILASIIFVATVHYYSSMVTVALTAGLIYGVSMIEFSILSTQFFTWFSTTDPNPDDPGRNPRVLARIGLLFFIVAGIVELVVSLT